MIALALASWLTTQTWAWKPNTATEHVTSYRLYWATPNDLYWCGWRRVQSNEIAVTAACDAIDCHGEIAMPTRPLVYVIVTAINSVGEGPTDHGPVCP